MGRSGVSIKGALLSAAANHHTGRPRARSSWQVAALTTTPTRRDREWRKAPSAAHAAPFARRLGYVETFPNACVFRTKVRSMSDVRANL